MQKDSKYPEKRLEVLLQKMQRFHHIPDEVVILALADSFPESRDELRCLAEVRRGYDVLIIQALNQTLSGKTFVSRLSALGCQLETLPRVFSDVVSPMNSFACLMQHDRAPQETLRLWTDSYNNDLGKRPKRG